MKSNIIHVELKFPSEGQVKHYYFGSLKAIFDVFGREDIGCVYSSLVNGNYKWIDNTLETKKAIIRKGEVIRCKMNINTD